MEPELNGDLHHALALAVLALTAARAAVEARVIPDRQAELQRHLDGGSKLALAVLLDGGAVHVELAVLPAEHRTFFENPLIRFDGPAAAALAPPGSVETFDRQRLN